MVVIFLIQSKSFWEKKINFAAEIANTFYMNEIYKRYRLSSNEEPSDEMLHELMEDFALEAQQSSAHAASEKRRRLQAVADEIKAWRMEQSASWLAPNPHCALSPA